ncbi:intradiol ring-cleavage dioxygenase [Deinococcus sp. KNUC1210]|uniref:intradiol ring-cleavage dioxygenase n=1 Tax=Deinococcus sp. KNUC1210 TaxID=2917691 RepID=UPI001EF0A96D|nr:intradiol ring-cleavage dioxygenase [Deinococcus sp. KNUC1210]ULH16457.1 intradiol ring-cleavage dioxygenase [Deinococcus sp. KNUC1210]
MSNRQPPIQLEDNDDEQVGTVLSRRRALTLLGSAGTVLGAGSLLASRAQAASTALPSCVVRPAQTQGPYFVDEQLNRRDIRSDPSSGKVEAGMPLTLGFLVTQVGAGGCKPLSGVQVDVWQANALGHYSDISGEHTKGQQFLRGYQTTNAQGVATFQTVYPGWYNGRTVHIHFKLRRGNATFTSQLFFEEALTDKVYQTAPYNTRGPRTIRNAQDNIFSNGGHQLMLNARPSGQGYAAVFDVGMNL